MGNPSKPNSAHFCHNSRENTPLLSRAIRSSSSCSRAKSKTARDSSRCSGLSAKSIFHLWFSTSIGRLPEPVEPAQCALRDLSHPVGVFGNMDPAWPHFHCNPLPLGRPQFYQQRTFSQLKV